METCFIQCPYCWQQISVVVDKSVANQNYIEDCEVCCNPISLEVKVAKNDVIYLQVSKL
ncbi:CPXCG motif-containing cysteine-rich protein [Mangrovimonas sp. YM274]|uniref:CPXCG motif-containing cysteine-rich protein n=1 Tax=Mangrovimonas sp. YM274 TaxID=3070660 RepID=UPI0027DDEAA4|nr:CPXCG motif-containing cysteine-rich protein [Mangrovimonas sp. YM274]WMI68268.1 CPXCG motif-containing cysteine-rich protein [Mangrovimonas sp. YM274]